MLLLSHTYLRTLPPILHPSNKFNERSNGRRSRITRWDVNQKSKYYLFSSSSGRGQYTLIFLLFHIPQLEKYLPFYTPEEWERYPFRGTLPVWVPTQGVAPTPGNKSPTYLTSFAFLFQLTKFTKMNVWGYFFYWSGSYPTGPDDTSCRSPSQKRAFDPTVHCN